MHARRDRFVRIVVLALVLAMLSGCAARKSFRKGERAMRRQNYDQAVLSLSKATALEPGNTRYSVALARAKVKSSNDHFQKGKQFAESEQLELAVAEFQQTLLLDPGHQFAATELRKVIARLENKQTQPSEIEQLKELARKRDLGPPRLDPRTNIPILLNFTDAKVGKIFEAIGKASGINFIFDDKTDLDKPMSIDIGNVTLEKALDILMLQTKNFYMPIDEYTLLVAPDTRQKRQEYEDQVIRTFFLSNADTKQVVTLLRSLLQARQIAENTDLNSVTIKDTPDKVAIAERIINANDKSRGEVLIDVELLEINRNVAQSLGLDLSSKTLSLTFRDGMTSLPLNDFSPLKQSANWTVGVVPSVLLNFLKTDGDTRSIAKPQLRVSEGEQAEILIGDRVPIPTTSFNTSQTIGGNIVPITSFTYQNVGITVQIEPRVHHNREVTLRIQVEISQLGAPVETNAGQSQPTIGTRQIQTVIRLRDGETNMLAGLIQETDTESYSGVSGLSSIPGLRRLFGNRTTSKLETDIIMTITPRIIRIPDITEDDLATLWVGTEENMRLRGPSRSAMGQGPFAPTEEQQRAMFSGGDPLPSTTPVRRGGSLARISPSQETGPGGGSTPPGAAGTPPGAGDSSGQRGRSPGARGSSAGSSTGRSDGGDLGGDAPSPPPGEAQDGASGASSGSSQRRSSGSAFDDDGSGDELAGPAMVRLVPTKTSYRVGETILVDVFLENGQGVGSVPFHLRYNKNVVQFVAPATEGPFLRSDGTSTVFLASDTGGGGEIVVGLSRLGGGDGVTGNGSLATFQFVAVAGGDCGFSFTGASVKDPQARNIPAAFSVISVKVEP